MLETSKTLKHLYIPCKKNNKKTPKCVKKNQKKSQQLKTVRSLHAPPKKIHRNHIYCIYNTLTCTGDSGSTYTGTLSITSC